MQYLTRSEYRKIFGGSRQSIANKIRRGTLPVVYRNRKVELIPVEDTAIKNVKRKRLTA